MIQFLHDVLICFRYCILLCFLYTLSCKNVRAVQDYEHITDSSLQELTTINNRAKDLLKIDPDSTILLSLIVLSGLDTERSIEAKGNALNNLGIAHYYKGNYDSSKLYNIKSLAVFKKIRDSIRMADVTINLGNLCFEQGDLPSALKHYEQAYTIYKKTMNAQGLAKALNNIGNVNQYQGNYKKALDYYYQTLEIETALGNKNGLAISFNNIGTMYQTMLQYKEALINFKKSNALYTELKNTYMQAFSSNQIATVFLETERPDSALILFNQALSLAKIINYTALCAAIENNLGETYFTLNNIDSALSYYIKASDTYKKLSNLRGLVFAEIGIGKALNKQNKYHKALSILKKNWSTAQKLESPDLIKFAAEELSKTYEGLKKYDEALRYYKVFKTMSDSLLNYENITKLTTVKLEYEFELEKRQLAYQQMQRETKHEQQISKAKTKRKMLLFTSSSLLILISLLFLLLLNRQKSRIDKLKIDINKNMQRLLSQQMNPHFIFNTLKSIQNFILNNDIKNSNLYLTQFSKLIRKILENSQFEVIPVKDEIEALELYVQLENLRLNNKFDFVLSVDPDINIDLTKVPSLLFQPYIENAIWHGLSKISNRGNLRLSFKKEKNKILCIIEDNGIGRKSANIDANHKSLGLEISGKRIQLINTLFRTEISPVIKDLKEETDGRKGTRVEFQLPIICNSLPEMNQNR
ncbi:MAG: tetratricopeptide repeat protein [Bacteroidales bacterium]|nr:tetratricopeptide repeat protein [Bacteroidales bacterium]